MRDSGVKRTLAAIVMADVVGYSRLIGEDDAGTLRRLTAYRAEFIDRTVADNRGRIVNAVGDSLLLEFGSVIDATLCAISLQRRLAERNAELAEPQRMMFRMGVNLGDVIVQSRGLFGDSVNVAARLQTLCEPGGLCLSTAAHEQVRGKIEAEFVDLGAHQVKNIARPVGAFALSAEAISRMPAVAAAASRASRTWMWLASVVILLLAGAALAVNPFLRTGKPDQAAQLGAALLETLAMANDSARAKLVEDFLSAPPHRALAAAPKAKATAWTGDWPTAGNAEEKALERCQVAFDEPCELVMVDDTLKPLKGVNAHIAHDMPRVRYAGDFRPTQIPGLFPAERERADVVGYAKAPAPKAAALHPQGRITVVLDAASQPEAEARALTLCQQTAAEKGAAEPCFLYAKGDKVVLPARLTSASLKP